MVTNEFRQTDTVFAPSTAIGGAIAVVRVSGPDTRTIAHALVKRELVPRMLIYTPICEHGFLLDDAMAVFFARPNSYTGEDMLELHCHGGMQTVRRISDALLRLGARPAEGGEFTKRAFLNGKMDLIQAEAVMDVINAQAEASLRSALFQLGGGISQDVCAIETILTDARASVEAMIDYPDEMEADVLSVLPNTLDDLLGKLDALIENGYHARVLRDGLRVVILGRPNVGKSSLFNALLGESRAIVTDAAGTTRDVLDERILLNGVGVRLMDTAGLRKAADEAESIGIDRARQAQRTADLTLVVLDGSESLTDEDAAILSETEGRNRIVLSNKSDLGICAAADLAVSCKTGEGLAELKERIGSFANPSLADTTYLTNMRHIRALERARDALRQARFQAEPDCIATELREAAHQIGTITGSDVDEQLLDRIFENFCVGK